MEMDAAPIRYSLNKRASVFLADDSDPFRRVSSQHFEGPPPPSRPCGRLNA